MLIKLFKFSYFSLFLHLSQATASDSDSEQNGDLTYSIGAGQLLVFFSLFLYFDNFANKCNENTHYKI